MSETHAIGIDLGTTYSAVAQLDVNGRTTMVRNSHGDVLTPSVVLFEDNEIVVGKEAKKALGIQPDRVAECVKRDMGSATFSKPIRGEYLPPEVIQSCILRKLKNDAVATLGQNIKAVITVPAYFDEPRRKATADAGEMAGLEVLDIVNEPTAAALAFGEQLGYLNPQGAPLEKRTVMVYDLGGGTFDVTVVELRPGNIRTLATDGDVRFGGHDWDARLADYLAEQFVKQHGQDPRENAASLARLMRTAEEAKHTLSARDHASVHVEYSGRASDIVVSRQQFESLTEDLLERTSHTARAVLTSACVNWSDVSHVILVGGSTRMPMVAGMLKSLSNVEPVRNVHPDEAVARGAAIYAAYLLSLRDKEAPKPKFEVVDVNSHSLGIEGIDQKTLRKENVVLIPRNTPLPCRKTEKFVTKHAGQQSVVVQVLEGESHMPEQCSPVARAVMRQLPSGLPKGWPIEVTYEYATNGRLSVQAKMPGTAGDVRIELEREKGLTDERLARWKLVVTSDRGFNAFESMLEQVLNLESPPATSSTAPSARPAAEPFRGGSPIPAAAAAGTVVATDASPTAKLSIDVGKPPAAPRDSPAARDFSAAGDPATLARMAASAVDRSATGAATPKTGAQGRYAGAVASTQAAEQTDDFPRERNRPRVQRSSARGLVINIIGFLVTAVLGLMAGYYIVKYIKPDSDILKLKFPWSSTAEPAPRSAGEPPAQSP